MKSIGFPVFDWDGISSTGFTVKTINPRKRNPLILKARAFTSSTLNQLGNINKIQPTSFNDVFNAWLVEMRSITP